MDRAVPTSTVRSYCLYTYSLLVRADCTNFFGNYSIKKINKGQLS